MARQIEPSAPRPKVSAERAEQLRVAKANQRIRANAAKYGVDVPERAQLKRVKAYTPQEREHKARVAAYQRRQASAERASGKAASEARARDEFISKLPQARNTKESVFIARPLKRGVAPGADAAAIRAHARAKKLVPTGKNLKASLDTYRDNGHFEGIRSSLGDKGYQRFRAKLERLKKLSPQTLAIYFHHEAGAGVIDSVIREILYPAAGGSSEEALERLENAVQGAEKAEGIYGVRRLAGH
jgi:hypothetical protein